MNRVAEARDYYIVPIDLCFELVGLIRNIRAAGTTIVMIEHVMQAVMALSDKIVVLHHGEKIFEGEPRAAVKDPAVVEAYLGEEMLVA